MIKKAKNKKIKRPTVAQWRKAFRDVAKELAKKKAKPKRKERGF
jgi:hypothetical protein